LIRTGGFRLLPFATPLRLLGRLEALLEFLERLYNLLFDFIVQLALFANRTQQIGLAVLVPSDADGAAGDAAGLDDVGDDDGVGRGAGGAPGAVGRVVDDGIGAERARRTVDVELRIGAGISSVFHADLQKLVAVGQLAPADMLLQQGTAKWVAATSLNGLFVPPAAKKEAIIAVSDTGPGTSAEDVAKLFERFYRGKASRAGDIPGFGLGLAISRALLERQGGRISVEAPAASGATFSVHLPRA